MNKSSAIRLLLSGALCGAVVAPVLWPASANANISTDLVCPCRVETPNLTSVTVSFGLRNLDEVADTGPLRVELYGVNVDAGGWYALSTIHLPSVAANSTLEPKGYTVPFRDPQTPGKYEFLLRIWNNQDRLLQTIRWIADHSDIETGGASFSSVYFDGTPTITITGESANVELPALKNAAGGSQAEQLVLSLIGARNPGASGGGRPVIARHNFNRNLQPGDQIDASTVTFALDSADTSQYLELQLAEASGRRLAYEIVSVPDGETLPSRTISTNDASLLVDTDGDGVGDVNERLMETDPADKESTPGEPTIDVLAMYTGGFADLYFGDPTTRIRHALTVTESGYRDSDVGLRFRLVGITEVDTDESDPYSTVDRDTVDDLAELYGADVGLLFKPGYPNLPFCARAILLARSNGTLRYSSLPMATFYGSCVSLPVAHEIGHIMGLAHSYAQKEVGTYRWARGHGVWQNFHTIMAYQSAYDSPRGAGVFSDPDTDCGGLPCGVDVEKLDGADSVTTLNMTRFQIANYSEEKPDSDSDGFVDPVDAFPSDKDEWLDTDNDGTGDNADSDDDGDGVQDKGDLFPRDASEWADTDGDGVGNNADAFPNDRFETLDSDGDGVGDNADRFPDDPLETVDTDNDGVGNNGDAFPFDTREWLDTDGDGVGDNADDDADGDGIANDSDVFPFDTARSDLSSYQLNLAEGSNQSLSLSSAGNIDDDGRADFLIATVGYDWNARRWNSAAYLVAAADLAAADGGDGTVDRIVESNELPAQSNSWKFIGEAGGSYGILRSAVMIGDVDGDDLPELLIGAPSHGDRDSAGVTGAAYLVSWADLPTADAADGTTDGIVQLSRIPTDSKSWMLVGEGGGDQAGFSVGALGDIDGDNLADLAIGAPGPSRDPGKGATYLVAAADLKAADEADGDEDGVIDLGHVAAQSGSLKLTGEGTGSGLGGTPPELLRAIDGDLQLLLSAPRHAGPDDQEVGAAYWLSYGDLAAADAADGNTDGVVDLGESVARSNSARFLGQAADPVQYASWIGDHDGDAVADLLVRSKQRVFFVSGAHRNTADSSDGNTDGEIAVHEMQSPNHWDAFASYSRVASNGGIAKGAFDRDTRDDVLMHVSSSAYLISGNDLAAIDPSSIGRLDQITLGGGSWRIDDAGSSIQSLGIPGDVDMDGRDDLLLGSEATVFVVLSSELNALDAADDQANGRIGLRQLTGDADGDGVANILDSDDDNDGVADFEDAFPHNPKDWTDTDYDGVGDNTDAFPDNPHEQFDTDGDGTGDRGDSDDDGDGLADNDDDHPLDTDNDGTDNVADTDDDDDGIPDGEDAFPLNASEHADFDADGVGDNADTDDDNDGVADTSDALPYDASESSDRDGDGVGDNSDAFPDDADETLDSDGDTIGNNADTDDDNDGTPDTADAFPFDAAESEDTDGDGIGNNADAFPEDASEWTDTDADGTGNNSDTDDDDDGYTDAADAYPYDPDRTGLFHYRLIGEHPASLAGDSVAMSDIDGDGKAEALIGAPRTNDDREGLFTTIYFGVAYAVSASDLEVADLADGLANREVRLRDIPNQPGSWAVTGHGGGDSVGQALAHLGDMNDDGKSEWMVGASGHQSAKGAAYLISSAELGAADSANGSDGAATVAAIADQPASWEFVGEAEGDRAGHRVAAAGDVNGDDQVDFLIAAPSHGAGERGAVYLVSGAGLAQADAADGTTDGQIGLGTVYSESGSWKFLGTSSGNQAGSLVATAGDYDGDGKADVIIGAAQRSESSVLQGVLYLIAAKDLASADEADEDSDGVIQLANIAKQASSWKLVGEDAGDFAGYAAVSADANGDQTLDLIVGAPGHEDGDGAVYVLPTTSLVAADTADGTSDHTIHLDQVAALENGWKLVGRREVPGHYGHTSGVGSALDASDLDGDGSAEILLGVQDDMEVPTRCGAGYRPGAVYVISSTDLALADAADGDTDGMVHLGSAARGQNSWKLVGEASDSLGSSVSASSDLDGDGRNDLVLGAARHSTLSGYCGIAPGNGLAVVFSSADLAAADAGDGSLDRTVDIGELRRRSIAVDHDGDGIEDALDGDDDNDTVADALDAFPLDPRETGDNDRDGIGDNGDPDDDNDGAPDGYDAFPVNSHETVDTDGDGIGNNADTDDDNDGVLDVDDAFALDASESADTDGDGIGDNADASPDNPAVDSDGDGIADKVDTDDDNDGVPDADDLFPFDASKSDLFFYRVPGEMKALNGFDFDGDGLDDIVARHPSNYSTLLVSSADLAAADIADGNADRVIDFDQESIPENSWRLENTLYSRVFPAGDVDNDDKDDLVVDGLLVTASSLENLDAADGERDRTIALIQPAETTGVWQLTGSSFAPRRYSLADLNSDGRPELLVGGRWAVFDPELSDVAVYVASGADLAAADSLDGVADSKISLDKMASRSGSWKIVGTTTISLGADIASAGDLNGDGHVDLIVGAPRLAFGSNPISGGAYVLSGAALQAIDAADGTEDGEIVVEHGPQTGVWKFGGGENSAGSIVSSAGDVDGDGLGDVMIDALGTVYLIAGVDVAPADAADGASDGVIRLDVLAEQPGSFSFDGRDYGLGIGDMDGDSLSDVLVVGLSGAFLYSGKDLNSPYSSHRNTGNSSSEKWPVSWSLWAERNASPSEPSHADLDGDGRPDLVVPTRVRLDGEIQGMHYIISTAELALLDLRDGNGDGGIHLDHIERRWAED